MVFLKETGWQAAWDAYLARQMVQMPLEKMIGGGQRVVLDIGAGSGEFARRGIRDSRLIAADVSRFPGLQVQCSATSLPFGDETFDIVLCLRVLQHIPLEFMAMKEIFRVTRRGGLAIVAVGNRWSWTLLQARMERPEWRARIPYTHYRAYTPAELEGRLREAGFEDVSVRGVLFLPEAINRLPNRLRFSLLKAGSLIDRLAGSVPGLRLAGTNLVAWGSKL